MLYYINISQEWCGDIEAENEEEAIKIAEAYFNKQEIDTSVVVLKED